MNKAVSFKGRGQIRSTMATGTKISSQLSEGFSNDFMLVVHQVTGTHYNTEHKSLLIDSSQGTIVVIGPKAWRFLRSIRNLKPMSRCAPRFLRSAPFAVTSKRISRGHPKRSDGSRHNKSAVIYASHERYGLGFFEVYLPQVLMATLLSLARRVLHLETTCIV